MTEQKTPTHAELAAQIPAPPPDDENPAIIFAKKTTYYTLGLCGLFIAAVVIFIL